VASARVARFAPSVVGGKALFPIVEQIGVADAEFFGDLGSWLPAGQPVVDGFSLEVVIKFTACLVHGFDSFFGQFPVRQFEATLNADFELV
jgi:hypothetical protein